MAWRRRQTAESQGSSGPLTQAPGLQARRGPQGHCGIPSPKVAGRLLTGGNEPQRLVTLSSALPLPRPLRHLHPGSPPLSGGAATCPLHKAGCLGGTWAFAQQPDLRAGSRAWPCGADAQPQTLPGSGGLGSKTRWV